MKLDDQLLARLPDLLPSERAVIKDVLTRATNRPVVVRAQPFLPDLRDQHYAALRRPPYRLTRRELDVLNLIYAGQTNKQAGLALGISSRTVEVHRTRLMSKLGVHNLAGLIRVVWQLVTDSTPERVSENPSLAAGDNLFRFGARS